MEHQGDVTRDRPTAELLRERLAATVPLDDALIELLQDLLGRLCREALPPGGQTLGRLLTNTGTHVEVLETIKEYGKKVIAQSAGEAERAVALRSTLPPSPRH